MSSTRLPKLTLRKPATAEEVRIATCSVPKPNRAARGMIAREEVVKMMTSDWWVQCSAQDMGIKTRSMIRGEKLRTLMIDLPQAGAGPIVLVGVKSARRRDRFERWGNLKRIWRLSGEAGEI